jgi:predicted PurR-regulated permease PerM
MTAQSLDKPVKILLFLFLFFYIIYHGRPFLVPVAFAGLLSMLLIPLSKKLEGWGVNRILAIVLSILALVAFFALVIGLLAWQISDMAQQAPEIEKNLTQKVQQVRQYVTSSLGIPQQKQQEIIQKQQQSSGNKMAATISGAFAAVGGLIANALLVLVYIFLFMYFRSHLKKFILKLVPKEKVGETTKVIEDSRKVAQKYMTGMGTMIVGLWIMYGIGFSIAGVKHAIFFAVLCGLLEIVPFVGNLAGTTLTIIMSLAQGGSMNMVIGILITYALVQFIQSYILEPLVVGSEVNINPVFTILGIIAGEFIWGIPGMILAIPILGITKIICDHVEPLKPYGFLLGEEKKSASPSVKERVQKWFKKGKS